MDRGNDYESPFQVEPRHGREALKRDIELQFGDDGLQRLARQLAATVEAIARHQPA